MIKGESVHVIGEDGPRLQIQEIDPETGDLILMYGPEKNVRRVSPEDVQHDERS